MSNHPLAIKNEDIKPAGVPYLPFILTLQLPGVIGAPVLLNSHVKNIFKSFPSHWKIAHENVFTKTKKYIVLEHELYSKF